ncbi:MAG: hypothetical protein CMJ74_02200 [Planctomycetaceae bacterium]|nr:hypothetical protein [Planctomycetaceae bacterium]|tara:strand:+ start:192 stop:560 length:369 start_codon:yes stop_codon:yes gene_type:complete
MAKCDEGYRCDVCGENVAGITESDLYLRYVIGHVDPETLHTAAERHIGCNPAVAQFIVDDEFSPITATGDFNKRNMDRCYVAEQEKLITRGWQRLCKLVDSDIPIIEYPLPEVRAQMQSRYR